MTSPVAMLLATFLLAAHAELVVPLAWAHPEGRLTFNISVRVEDTWYTSISRVDLGSQVGLMLPSSACVTTGCSSCVNDGCRCAPSQALLMPADKCPDGSAPSGSGHAKHGRELVTCADADVDVAFGSQNLTLRAGTLTPVLYMTKVAQCSASSPAKTGFNGVAPFTHALYEQLGSATLRFSMGSQRLTFGAAKPSAAVVTTPWSMGGESGGRQVKIIAVNGKPVSDIVAAIDSGNGAFLTYGSGSPLEAANRFPFSVTFEGGNTMVFGSAPLVNGVATRASEYSHNVLALGFMANYDLTFDDAAKVVYFSDNREGWIAV